MTFIIETEWNDEGTLDTFLKDKRGREVASILGHSYTAEELIRAARQYAEEHPEKFGLAPTFEPGAGWQPVTG